MISIPHTFDPLATIWLLLAKVWIQKDVNLGAREMGQPLKAQAALAEELGSIPYIYMVAHNHTGGPMSSSRLCGQKARM